MRDIIIERVFTDHNKLCCKIDENGVGKILFFEVEEKYNIYLVDDRADAFFVVCLYKAIKEGYNLISHVPISERLLYQITHYMNDVLASVFNKKKISIIASATTVGIPKGEGVATGITCGVDSLFTIATHDKKSLKDCSDYAITHLALFNVGSHRIGAENEQDLFASRVKLAKEFCLENDYQFVLIDSNISSFLEYDYTEYFGIINCATVLSLQKLFKIYYSSSSYMIREFKLNPLDVSQFELFNLFMLSTDNTQFYSVGSEYERYEKMKLLVDYKPSYNFLNVCNTQFHNCSRVECVKCSRTMIALDLLDSLDKYRNVFDVVLYEKNRYKYLANMYARYVVVHDHFAIEMMDDIRRKYHIPFYLKVFAIAKFVYTRLKMYKLSYIRYRIVHR